MPRVLISPVLYANFVLHPVWVPRLESRSVPLSTLMLVCFLIHQAEFTCVSTAWTVPVDTSLWGSSVDFPLSNPQLITKYSHLVISFTYLTVQTYAFSCTLSMRLIVLLILQGELCLFGRPATHKVSCVMKISLIARLPASLYAGYQLGTF